MSIVFGSPEARAIQTRDAQLRAEERAFQDKLDGFGGNTYDEKVKGMEKMLAILAAEITDAEDEMAAAEERLDACRAEQRSVTALLKTFKMRRPEFEV